MWAVGDTSALTASAIRRRSDLLMYWLLPFSASNSDICQLLWSVVASGKSSGRPLIEILTSIYSTGRASKDCTDEHGSSPLMLAAYHGQMSAVKMLLAMEFDPRLRNTDGHDAVAFARAGRAQLEDLLANYCPQLSFLGNNGDGLTLDSVCAGVEWYNDIIDTLTVAPVNYTNSIDDISSVQLDKHERTNKGTFRSKCLCS